MQKLKYIFYKTGINNIRDFLQQHCRIFRIRDIYSSSDGQLRLPSEVTWELTYRCNLNCVMCFQNREIDDNELDTQKSAKIINGLTHFCKKINLTGGEIFLRQDIFEILRMLEKRRIKVFIMTNGTLLDESKIELLVKFCNIIGIQFSLDGSRKIHDKIRGMPGAFDKTYKAIKVINNRLRTVLSCVISQENLEDLPNVLKVARELKISNITYTFEYFNTYRECKMAKEILGENNTMNVKVCNNYNFEISDMQSRIRRLKTTARSYGIGIVIAPQFTTQYLKEYLSNTDLNNLKLACAEITKGRIDPYGNITFCQSIRKKFGNLTTKSFSEIWTSEYFKQFRQKVVSTLPFLTLCRRCCRLRII